MTYRMWFLTCTEMWLLRGPVPGRGRLYRVIHVNTTIGNMRFHARDCGAHVNDRTYVVIDPARNFAAGRAKAKEVPCGRRRIGPASGETPGLHAHCVTRVNEIFFISPDVRRRAPIALDATRTTCACRNLPPPFIYSSPPPGTLNLVDSSVSCVFSSVGVRGCYCQT